MVTKSELMVLVVSYTAKRFLRSRAENGGDEKKKTGSPSFADFVQDPGPKVWKKAEPFRLGTLERSGKTLTYEFAAPEILRRCIESFNLECLHPVAIPLSTPRPDRYG
uniref:Uncharacterized protein n=1 Tax=Anopheles maculatus TaxID=74869 RepID=A0A182SYF8_9DIPT